MQSIAESCVRFDAAHLSINLVSEIAVPMFTTLRNWLVCLFLSYLFFSKPDVIFLLDLDTIITPC